MITKAQAILREEICEGEGTSWEDAERHGLAIPYDITFGYGSFLKPYKPISQMTMAELDAFQVDQINATKGHITGTKYGSSAAGRYQCIRGTLEEMRQIIGWTSNDLYSAELQDKIFVQLLKRRGYDDWLAGKMGNNSFQVELAKEWASIAMPGSDKSYYGQPVGTTDAEIKEAMLKAKIAHEESLKPPPIVTPPIVTPPPPARAQLVADIVNVLAKHEFEMEPAFQSYNHMAEFMVSSCELILGPWNG